MTRVYIADTKPEELSELLLFLLDLKFNVVGEAVDWFTTLLQVPISRVDMLLVDWDLLPKNAPNISLYRLRKACPSPLAIIITSHHDSRKQAAISIGADLFISKGETPEQVAEHLRNAATNVVAID